MTRAIGLIGGLFLLQATFSLSLSAKCPVSDGATVVVRAPVGDLQVDTTGREAAVDVQVDSNDIQLQENCGKGTW